MKTPLECPRLTNLADACDNGACNSYALIRALGEALPEVGVAECRSHPAVKVVLGQVTYLLGESAGPSMEAYDAFRVWRNQSVQPQAS